MIDMHTHILPGIDDGAKDINQSVQMLAESYRQGVDICISTSHCKLHDEHSLNEFLVKRENSYNILCDGVKGIEVPQIILGAEVYLDNDISRYKDIEKLCIQGTKYILVEFGRNMSVDMLSEWLYNLNLKGFIPIIAHIDRYGMRNEMIKEFEGLTLVYQVNNSEVLTIFGRRFLKKLAHCTVVMGSDMHNTTTRPGDMKKAYSVMSKKMPKAVDLLYKENPKHILGK